MPELATTLDAEALQRAARAALDEALAGPLHLPGARERHRLLLGRAIERASSVIAGPVAELPIAASARATLVLAHAARARDARHGANQLSLGSQRAPTEEDCDDGWRRVEAIVAVAEASATEAARLASDLDDAVSWKAARAAESAARDARRLVEERNHAYTFHADPGFSFGEGCYLAAAAVLGSVAIQIEPDRPQTAQAERFVRDAGLAARLAPYRARPRANKALPDIVARAFRADPRAAQARLRAAFLGDAPIPRAIVSWTDHRLVGAWQSKRVLVWIRRAAHHPARNSTYPELVELCRLALGRGLGPVLIGDALVGGEAPPGALDLTLFWKLPLFQGVDMRRAQLQLFEHLRRAHGLVGQVGVTTAGMDGPALLGLPTMYLTQTPNLRLGKWVGAVPGYEQVVRNEGYLERIAQSLGKWVGELS